MSMQGITEAMEALNALYMEMLELGGQKRQLIVHNDVDGLTKVMSAENRLMKRSAELEKQRLDAVGGYLQEKKLRLPASITMMELTRVVFNLEEKERLHRLHAELSETIGNLKEVNESNQHLIKQSLDFIELSIDLLTGAPVDQMTYTKPNQTTIEGGRYSYFDHKA
ncbi:flagellar protein FlgN [Paenibacillus gansuensis]|uniref:Flagellar protein FlgN n=1 Tax=Paenibacillus gansuensis TaxID=306542 RepID=A0ABW5PMV9_9BACL